MDKEQERKVFEAWCNQNFVVNKLHRWREGYEDARFAYAWEAWQARAKQTITLPVKDATGEH